jgi:2-C-methyl-D-erythritol 4-phosphate cytidylyltransferase/2-C-methyl-D-erythritol 2,4-cyclodiphosphate synthase
VRTESRADLWQAQTPQMFRYRLLMEALSEVGVDAVVTDEASAVEQHGYRPRLVMGDSRNLKVTYPQDLALAELILKNGKSIMRVGQGFDVHALVAGRRLVIGGVDIPFERGLAGHSDADVLLHAITDALLGAAALGDIGRHFPDTDPRYRGADSRVLLRDTVRLLAERGFGVVNVDSTVITEAPRLARYIPAMVENIAADLGIPASAVNVKAKTAERLGFVGRGEGIVAEAVVLITESRHA